MSLWAVRWIPRSKSLTDRGDRLAASASSSCVSPASARSRRSNPANPRPGCSATVLNPLGISARSRQPGTDKTHPKPTQTRPAQPAPASTGQLNRRGNCASLAPSPPEPSWPSHSRTVQSAPGSGRTGMSRQHRSNHVGSYVGHQVW